MSWAKWWKNLRFSRERSASVASARQLLLEEQQRLSEDIEKTWRVYQERLQDLKRRAAKMDPIAFNREAATIQAAQRSLQSVMRRLDVAEKETRELLDEWHDWERLSSFSDVPSTDAAERQEMIRSELVLRGVALPKQRERNFVDSISESESLEQTPSASESTDDFPEWDEVMSSHIPQTVKFWESRVKESLTTNASPSHLAEELTCLRHAHAEQRLWDRETGETRERMGVFGN